MKIAGSLAAVAAVAVLVVALAAGSATGANPAPAGGVSALTDHFAVLQTATPERIEAVASPVRRILEGQGNVEAVGSASGIALADVSGSVCAFQESPEKGGGTCGSPAEAVSGKLLSVSFCGAGTPEGTARIFGVVPDGVESVTLDGSDGRSRTVAVAGNVYEAQLPAVATTVAATGKDGGRIELSLPLDQLAKANSPCG